MSEVRRQVEEFLAAESFAVVGASSDPDKYGNKVYRCYKQHGRQVFPINPGAAEILGDSAYPDLASLPEPVQALSIITPPAVTERVMEQAAAAGVRHVWMQPGAESEQAIETGRKAGMNVIAGGPCLLVVLGYREG